MNRQTRPPIHPRFPRLHLSIAALALLVCAAFAPAAKSPIDDPEADLSRLNATQVGELVVRPPGPAWWTVSKGPRRVHILGIFGQFPAGMEWSKATLDRRLNNADRVITPPMLSGSSLGLPPNLPRVTLPADLQRRIQRLAPALGKADARYLGVSTVEAGLLLATDFRARLGVAPGVIIDQVATEARRRGRTIAPAGVISADLYAAQLKATSPEASVACLEAALAEVEGGSPPFKDAVEAWAAGDVRGALDAPRSMERCTFALPGQADLRRRATELQVAAIAKALDRPAPASRQVRDTLAVVNLRTLLADGGVLDQLRAKGYEIASPQF